MPCLALESKEEVQLFASKSVFNDVWLCKKAIISEISENSIASSAATFIIPLLNNTIWFILGNQKVASVFGRIKVRKPVAVFGHVFSTASDYQIVSNNKAPKHRSTLILFNSKNRNEAGHMLEADWRTNLSRFQIHDRNVDVRFTLTERLRDSCKPLLNLAGLRNHRLCSVRHYQQWHRYA